MKIETIQVLLIEDHPGDARLVREMLAEAKDIVFSVTYVRLLSEGVTILKQTKVDVVLLDLSLPDSNGLSTFESIQDQFPEIPMVLLTGFEDVSVAIHALNLGAQDYLVKGQVDGSLLERSLRYAIERKRVEEALKKSERRLRSMVENLPAGAVYREGDSIFFNKAVEKITGYQPHEITTISEWFSLLYGGEGKRFAAEYEADRATQFADSRIQAIVRKDGQIRFVEFAGYSYEQGEVWLLYDITERLQAEQLIREQATLLNQSQDAIWVLDRDNRVQFWNQGAEQLFEWKAAEVMGKPLEAVFRDCCQTELVVIQKEIAEKGGWRGELHMATKSGRELIVESRWTVSYDSQGRPQSKLTVNTDISDKKRLENEFMRATQLSLIGELAAGLAHEIKNPLAGIQGAVDILIRRRSPGDPERTALEAVRREVGRIDGTVRELLNRARPRALTQVPTLLNEIVRHAVVLSRHQATVGPNADRRIAIDLELPTDPIVASIDTAQMEDAILNLILNALDAVGDRGQITVRLKLVKLESPNRPLEAVIEVEDNGRGIAESDLAKIFHPFYTTSPRGTGLGLPAVRRIARAHGGQVDVKSEIAKGSMFTLRIPLGHT